MTEQIDQPAPVENHPCIGCGQLDDHPMIHVAPAQFGPHVNPSFHYDCLPPVFEALLGNEPQHQRTLATIAAARSGIHGAELYEHIAQLPDDNNVELTTEG